MKHIALFFQKIKVKKLKCRLLQFLFGNLKVKFSSLHRVLMCTEKMLIKGRRAVRKLLNRSRSRGYQITDHHLSGPGLNPLNY